MSVLTAWWANPFTAVLLAGAMLVVLGAVVAGFVAVVRLGAIQLGGLLAQRPALLPGYPRRGDGHASLVVFMLFGVGVVWLGFALAVVRAALLSGVGLRVSLAVALAAWLAVFALALLLVRGSRVELLAAAALATLGPFTPLLSAVARWEGQDEEAHPDDEAVDEHEVQAFIGAGEEAGILEREDAVLVASIVDFSDTVAREVMTPRTDVVALPADADFETVARRFAESMFTRIPVYRETLDRIEGLLHVKDVLRASQAGTRPGVAELMHPVLVVPETKQLRELLREFQSSRQQLAVLVDEYGGTSGIVTLEDLLEEIVGEIQDEHQREQPDVQPEGDGIFLVRGTAHIEELEELFGVEVGEVGFDSVAGLVLDRLGHLPRPGEKVAWHGLELEAVEVDRRRLRRLRIRRTGAGT
jgi:CBS domain containing-hemolysin-like protein